MILITSSLLTIFFVFYSKYQFLDLRNQRNLIWKRWGVAIRILFLVACFIEALKPSVWQDYLLAGSINILLFELLINKIALKANWFYKGNSSVIDNNIGNTKWYIMFGLLILSILVKIFIK